jgi:hypothetical protein
MDAIDLSKTLNIFMGSYSGSGTAERRGHATTAHYLSDFPAVVKGHVARIIEKAGTLMSQMRNETQWAGKAAARNDARML